MEQNKTGIVVSFCRRSTNETHTPHVFTKKEKRIMLAIKNASAFSWGFLNTIVFHIASRFAMVMTGNLIILATEASTWKVEEMVLTLTIIMAFIFAGSAYTFISILVHQNTVVLYLIPLIVSLGVMADILQYVSDGCTSRDNCSGNHLYFLTPISILIGLVSTGYQGNNPDGINTSSMEDHLTVNPKTIVHILFTECRDRDYLIEKCRRSVSIILNFCLGVIAANSMREGIWIRYSQGQFTPLFSCFGIIVAILIFIHYNYCTRFFEHHRLIDGIAIDENIKRYSIDSRFTETIDEESLEKPEEDDAVSNCTSLDITLSESDEDPYETWNEEDLEIGETVGGRGRWVESYFN